ncbi:MAG: DnaB-like helicase C-terminal domain-containing protein [Candidatus Theseobacter exili]|nr:DnaB-like helicase C-terminal domain-containing protein [Candidatus Theseobacter exili]
MNREADIVSLINRINVLDMKRLDVDELIDIVDIVSSNTLDDTSRKSLTKKINEKVGKNISVLVDGILNLLTDDNDIDDLSEYMKKGFFEDIESYKKQKDIKTGYKVLDEQLGGLHSGLYIVGGGASIGKTTLINQMSDQLASKGQHVIFFSIEQGKFEIISKSIARLANHEALRKKEGVVITSKNIRQGLSNEFVETALKRYNDEIVPRTMIKEGNFKTSSENIREIVSRYIQKKDVKPIVFVDYLQIIPNNDPRVGDKQKTDLNITALKQMSRDLNIPIWAISSLNRNSYTNSIEFESMKESGSIEYSADYLFGLELVAVQSNTRKVDEKLKKEFKDAKKITPREVVLSCLKNRSGISSFEVYFEYQADKDYFKDVIPSKRI